MSSRNEDSAPQAPPEAWQPLLRLRHLVNRPIERFLAIEAASGILLLAAAAVALLLANSPWSEAYLRLWEVPFGVRLGGLAFERSLAWFVNDGLMVIFFFVIGLEIRREIAYGELSEWRRASLPIAAAVGGMLLPAGFYLLLASEPAAHSGWGAAMATDIAFAVGILTLLGKRVPPALRVLLLAIAVIDDLGAILVIALFYSSGIALPGLLVAAGGLLAVVVMQRAGIRSKVAYVLPGIVAWAGTYAAGVHPTIAGVVLGLMTPVRAWRGAEGLVSGLRKELDRLEAEGVARMTSHDLAGHLRAIDAARREALSPAESLIESLHPWVAYAVMPLFALANSGVSLAGFSPEGASMQVASGLVVGLVAGKPCGILLTIWLTQKLGVGRLPAGLGAAHVLVLGVVAGIGFTMSLFIAQLAFASEALLAAAKLGILAASGIAGVLALLIGRALLRERA